ncbi:hypothetical protein [Noviherbaspirillum aerium]|uniref:hypothetical protein n=1 Tax=Noviherbaspirillum aerium TaxID=2588497 RepID=UPI00124E99EE|nr:hypothetical protein [Noviherbaspirillum aerium]
MWIERCSNWRCRRPYQVNEFKGEDGNLFGDELRPEQVTCPHCGQSETRWTTSIFISHALSFEEEEHFQQTRHDA